MKPIGITRHLDDFGRIVIPREVRKRFNIKHGDLLEVFTDNKGNIVLKKYDSKGE